MSYKNQISRLIFRVFCLIFTLNMSLFADNLLIKKPFGKSKERADYFWSNRLNANQQIPSLNEIQLSQNFESKNPKILSSEWESIGPDSISSSLIRSNFAYGRLNVIKFHPFDRNIIYVGSASGGLWKSIDRGKTWNLVNLPTFFSGISEIAIAQNNPDVMYIVTGDKFASSNYGSYSSGILKSVDNGLSWSFVFGNFSLSENITIHSLLLNPNNQNELFVCAENFVLYSDNGGESWDTIRRDKNVVFRDIIYWGESQKTLILNCTDVSTKKSYLMITDNKGKNWDTLSVFNDIGRVELDLSIVGELYALQSDFNGNFAGLFVSFNIGETWQKVELGNLDPVLYQGLYNLTIAVSPFDPNFIYFGGVNLAFSTDRGKNWQSAMNDRLHVDMHDIQFSPFSNEVFVANDGGLYSAAVASKDWKYVGYGKNITQFYKFAVSPFDNESILGGSQDNGTYLLNNGSWRQTTGSDGGESIFDPFDNNVFYTSSVRGNIFRTTDKGITFNNISSNIQSNERRPWITQMSISKQKKDFLAIGYEELYFSENRGNTWLKITNVNNSTIITALKISNYDDNVLAFGKNGILYYSKNRGANFDSLVFENRYIAAIEFDKNNDIYITFGGYESNSKVLKLNFETDEILDISSGLPNVPINAICYIEQTDEYYIGCDIGLFVKNSKAITWSSIPNLPQMIIEDIEYNELTGVLYLCTFGKGIWKSKIFDCKIDEPFLNLVGEVEICYGDSLELVVKNTQEGNYIWNDGFIGAKRTIFEEGDYFVKFENDKNCSTISKILSVKYAQMLDVNIRLLGNSRPCVGDTIMLYLDYDRNEIIDVMWSNGETSDTIAVFESGEYSVKVSQLKKCDFDSQIYEFNFASVDKSIEVIKDGNLLIAKNFPNYQWYRNGIAMPNQTSDTLKINQHGVYVVLGIDDNYCQSLSSSIEIEYSDYLKFELYPNPASNELNIIIFNPYSEELKCEIYDMEGRIFEVYYTNEAEIDFLKINIGSLSNGVYFIKVKEVVKSLRVIR